MKDSNNHSHCEADSGQVWRTDRGRLLSRQPSLLHHLLLPVGAVEEGAVGDLLLDNKPTFKEGHASYVTLCVGNITGGGGLRSELFCVGGRGSIMPRPRARSPRDLSSVTHFVTKKK